MVLWFLIAIAVLGIAIPMANSLIDRLVRLEYDAHREEWEKDGRPIGTFFTPPEAKMLTSRFAFYFCKIGWMLSTPEWIREDPTAIRLLRRFRLSIVAAEAGFIFLVYLVWRLVAARNI